MFIYKITNKINGMAYVGATTRSVHRRMSDHYKDARRGLTIPIYVALREFGFDNFEVETLDSASTFDELMQKEIAAIKKHGTMTPGGYNQATGGLGTPDRRCLESTREKIAAKAIGRAWSEEAKAKVSATLKGRPSPTKGMKFARAWNTGVPATEEHKQHLREARARNGHPHQRAVEIDGVVYPSMSAAASARGVSRAVITRIIDGEVPKADREGAPRKDETPLEYNGVIYRSINAACRATGLSKMQMQYRIRKGEIRLIRNLPDTAVS